MTYASGTFTGTTTPAKDTMEGWLHTALAAGLTYVEEVTGSGSTTRIYKSTLAANGVGEWFLAVHRTADNATALRLSVFETWDATGKKARHYIPASAQTPNAADLHRVTDAAGQTLSPWSGSVSFRTLNLAALSTNYTYWISASNKRVAVGVRVGVTAYGVYSGLLRNVIPTSVQASAAVQLVCYDVTTADQTSTQTVSASSGGFTREPGQAASAAQNYAAGIKTSQSYTFGYYSAATIDSIYSGRAFAAPQTISTGRSPNIGMRGVTYDCMLYQPGSHVGGDTATLTDPFTGSTKSYVCLAGDFWADTTV